jgi:glycosyltransferase involved in cell wall biosynthesis
MSRLLSVNSYHYRRGGADVVYFEHAALLESLGWNNAFFAMHYPQNDATEWSRYFVDEVQFGHSYSLSEKIVKATKVIYSFEAQRKLRQLISDYKPTIAHLHNIYHHLSPSILPVLRKAGIPTVLTAHDLKIACPNNRMLNSTGICERCKGGHYFQVVRNRCVQESLAASAIVAVESVLHNALGSYRNNVDKIMVPSKFFIEKFVEWGWPRQIFAHVPNYVDASRFTPSYQPGGYFLYLGRLFEPKGVLTAVRAALAAKVPLKIAGAGPLEDVVRQMAQKSGGMVEMLGYRTGSDLRALIGGCRAIVLPSEIYENAPLSILEGFAAGKPVIGARIGGIPEMMREGENGWLYESGNVEALAQRMAQVQGMPEAQIVTMGRFAREFVQRNFSLERYLNGVREVYGELGVRVPQVLPANNCAVV